MNEKNEDADDVYNVNMESKVTDMTLLTSEMQIMCRGKEMYWADKGKKEQEGEHGVGNRKCPRPEHNTQYKIFIVVL